MLIKIQHVEEDQGSLEDEVEQLKRRINRMLKEEKGEKDNQNVQHEEEIETLY